MDLVIYSDSDLDGARRLTAYFDSNAGFSIIIRNFYFYAL